MSLKSGLRIVLGGFCEHPSGLFFLQLVSELRFALLTGRRLETKGKPGLFNLVGDGSGGVGDSQLAKMGMLLAERLQSADQSPVEGVDAELR